MNPNTLKYGTKEYKNLEAVAKMLEAISLNEATYEVQEVYFDFGQDWMWTTICRSGYRDCQILSPRQWNNIIFAQTLSDIIDCIEDIRNDDYFLDK